MKIALMENPLVLSICTSFNQQKLTPLVLLFSGFCRLGNYVN